MALAVAWLSFCLAEAIILKTSIFGIKSSEESNYKFLETAHFNIRYSEILEQLQTFRFIKILYWSPPNKSLSLLGYCWGL